MGAPGAGKGTYADGISKYFGIPHISTGDIFRQAIKEGTPMGVLAKGFIDQGHLVPDDVTNCIVKERLLKEDCKYGFLLDGYPRNIYQAESFSQILKDMNISLTSVINLVVSDNLIVSRIVNRRLCPTCGRGYNLLTLKPKQEGICDDCGSTLYQRKDDNEETIQERLDIYNEQTKPLIDYYTKENLLINLSGEGEANAVTQDIIKELVRLYGNN